MVFSSARLYTCGMETKNVDSGSPLFSVGLSDEQLRAAKEIELPELLAPLPDDLALNVDLLA